MCYQRRDYPESGITAPKRKMIEQIASRGTRATRENWWWAAAMIIGKFPEMVGQIRFLLDRFRRVKPRLIEYK